MNKVIEKFYKRSPIYLKNTVTGEVFVTDSPSTFARGMGLDKGNLLKVMKGRGIRVGDFVLLSESEVEQLV